MKAEVAKIGTGRKAATAALVLLFALCAAAWSQSVAVAEEFPAELKLELRRLSWDDGAIEALEREPVDWSGFRAGYARVVAEALAYAKGAVADIGPPEQARVAVETCSMIQQMQSLGYGETASARAVFAAVRASLREITAWRSGDGQGDLEQRIRNRFRQELRFQTAGMIRAQARARVRVETRGDAGAPVIGPGPSSSPGRN